MQIKMKTIIISSLFCVEYDINKGGKLMKKIDKNKLHQLIGKILLYISLYLLAIGMLVLGFIKNTIY